MPLLATRESARVVLPEGGRRVGREGGREGRGEEEQRLNTAVCSLPHSRKSKQQQRELTQEVHHKRLQTVFPLATTIHAALAS